MNKTSSPDFFPFWVSDCPLGHCGHPHQLLIPEKPLHVDGLFVSISVVPPCCGWFLTRYGLEDTSRLGPEQRGRCE